MSDSYVPQVGDQVRRPNWSEGKMITVTAVGKECLLAIGNFPDGVEWEASFHINGINGDWVKVEPPPTYPEQWINVYYDGHPTRETANHHAGWATRAAVIHMAADGTVTLHPTTSGAS